MSTPNFDIIIVGAGISGLLLGSQLSQTHSILIIEKEDTIPLNKYWLTNKKCSESSPELIKCVDTSYCYMDFHSYDGKSFRCSGEYLLWDTEKLTEELERIILSNSGVILKKHTFFAYQYSNDSIVISVNDKKFSSKLLVDCMGYSSPIIYAKHLIRIYGYYILNGSVVNLKKQIEPIGLSNILLSNRPKFLEVFPKSNNQAYVVLIEPEKSIKKNSSLGEEIKFIIEKSEYSQYFEKPSSESRYLYGLIPVGKLRTNALDRIFLFGEAGQMNPAATATCLTQLFYSYKEIASKLLQRLETNQLSKEKLVINTPYFTNGNKKFHLNLFRNILNWTSDDFSKLIYQMNKMDHDLVNQVIFGEINFKSLLNSKNIKNLIVNKNYFVLKPLLKSLLH